MGAIAKDQKKKKIIQLIYKLDEKNTQLAIDMIKLFLKHNDAYMETH